MFPVHTVEYKDVYSCGLLVIKISASVGRLLKRMLCRNLPLVHRPCGNPERKGRGWGKEAENFIVMVCVSAF